ncbi:HAMP domain-containing protein [Streptomyces sp. JV185]|uniref:HAMP domain-containing protein n=1 Tax=Streptomyces sp. JV185 TaxID=858638 RepID=UPI002E7884C6|nr:HAMP domain-containing protein [Streptomyces sp. JV185]MEE1770204.1 HAMP domain-containing protein [Streptomyces sp. JV185]
MLRPVDVMRARTAEITGTDLSRRLDVPPANDALGRLATTFNDLLGRLDAATRRQRRFVADAAHELRSPLSTLHTRLEVAHRHPESARWQTLAPDLTSRTIVPEPGWSSCCRWKIRRACPEDLPTATPRGGS